MMMNGQTPPLALTAEQVAYARSDEFRKQVEAKKQIRFEQEKAKVWDSMNHSDFNNGYGGLNIGRHSVVLMLSKDSKRLLVI